MTTLPQTTTTVRLPRPAGAIQSSPAGGVPAPVSQGTVSMTGADVWRVIRNHIWLILGLLIISGIAGYLINRVLAVRMPRYRAVGYIRVVQIRDINPLTEAGGIASDQLAIEQKTQAVALRSDGLLTTVLQDPNSDLRKTKWFQSFKNIQDAKDDFFSNYSVSPLSDTSVLEISFTYSDPRECAEIVKAMVTEHLKNEAVSGLGLLQDATRELTDKRRKIQLKMGENEVALVEMRSRLSIDGGGLSSVGLKQIEMSQMGNAKFELERLAHRASDQYQAIMEMIKNGQVPPIVQQYVDSSPMVQNLRQQLDSYDTYLKQLAFSVGPKHKSYVNALSLRDDLQKRLEDTEAELRAKAEVQVIEESKQAMDTTARDFEDMKGRLETLKHDMGDLATEMDTYVIRDNENRGLREELHLINEKLDNASAKGIQNMQTKVQWWETPVVPTNMQFPKLPIVMSVAIAIGLALGLGIAFLREMTDQTIRSPRDIARVGQMMLLGMVADENDDPQAAGARLPLLIFDAPHSMTAEQLRQVRTRLQHAASLDTTRSIMVTSPGPGDGKTTIACNLAAGLALNGRRILLVDANFRRPEIHKIFAVSNDRGFSDVLNGAVTFDEVVHETQVPNLAIMSSGPRPINATEMFESQLLGDFVERALEEFDHVVFDSGPLLVVSEAEAMAPRVDGVVSVVRARGNSRGVLGRMRDALRKVKAEHLGVVLNAVRAQGGGYYRSSIQTYYDYNG